MTAWTEPATWADTDVPTKAQLDLEIRDKLLHLKETIDGWGYTYTLDPHRLNPTITIGTGAIYMRSYGRATISKIRVRIVTASGNICLGFYTNSGSGFAAFPGTRSATTGLVTCPAAGSADVSLDAAADMSPGDWFAVLTDNLTATAYGFAGATGFDLGIERLRMGQPIGPTVLPDQGDPSLTGQGSSTHITMIGVP